MHPVRMTHLKDRVAGMQGQESHKDCYRPLTPCLLNSWQTAKQAAAHSSGSNMSLKLPPCSL